VLAFAITQGLFSVEAAQGGAGIRQVESRRRAAEAHSGQCSRSSAVEGLADASECFVKAERCC